MNTSTPPTIESILAQCLDAVLRGDLTVAECVQRYPDYADELRPLLLTALLTRRLKATALPNTQVDALEQVLRAQMPPQKKRQPRIIAFSPALVRAAMRAAAAVVIVCLMLFGGGAGLVSASADALPGDALYGVKRFWEEVRIVVASLLGGLDALSLELADERLSEVQALAAMGKLTDAALRDLTDATERAVRHNAGSPALDAYLIRAQQTMTQIQPPQQSQAVYQQTLSVFEQVIQTQDAPTPTVTPPLPTPTNTPDETQAVASPTLTPTSEIIASPTPTFTATLRFPPTPTRTPTVTPSRTSVVTATLPQGSPTATWTDLPRNSTPFAPTTPAPVVGVTIIPLTPEATTSQTLWVRQTQQSVYMTQTAQAPASPTP